MMDAIGLPMDFTGNAQTVRYGLALLGGLTLGLFFYGGLWWTVRRLLTVERPELWTVGSFFVRTTLTVAGFYLLSGGALDRIAMAMIGFLIMRAVLVRRWGPHQVAGALVERQTGDRSEGRPGHADHTG